jgi:hypothetical protein
MRTRVGIVNRLLAGWPRNSSSIPGSDVSLLQTRTCVSGCAAHPPSCSKGTGFSLTEVKRPGREADHSPPPSVEVHSDKFPFTLL